MFSATRTIAGRINLTLLGLAILLAILWFTDQATNRQPVAPRIDPAAVLAQRRAAPSDARVFIYIIDSLRDDVARNPAIMPNLAALGAEGASVRMLPGFNSGSAAALRDAFTGRENAAVLAVVATFIHTDAGVESIFHQMAQAGLTTAAYSAGYFKQFGPGITREVVLGLRTTREAQDAHVLAAVEALRSGDFNCAIGHVAFTDAIAHEQGVGTPVYEDAFRHADALIPVIRARLPAGATLVVMGDHGHDLRGRHGIGLNVPTLAVYAGPLFRRGADLGTTPIMSHRYLLSQALGLPVTTEAYAGDLLPQALNLQQAGPAQLLSGLAGVRREGSWGGWIYVSLLAALWVNLVCRGLTPLDFSGGRALALWAGLGPFLLTGRAQAVAMAVIGAGLVLLTGWGRPWRQLLRWLALPVAAGLGLQGWGRVLVALRPELEQLPLAGFAAGWLVVAAAGAWLATPGRRVPVMAVVFAVPALLLPPAYHHFGFPGTIAPLLGCWFVFYAVSLAREGRLAGPGARWRVAGLAAGLFLLLQPLAIPVYVDGAFARWQSLVPGWTVRNTAYILLPTLLAHALIFFPQRPRWRAALLGGALVLLVELLAARLWTPDAYWRRGLELALLAGWVLAAWRGWREGARLLGLAALFVLYFSFVALTPRNFLETAAMIGALALCAQLAAWFPQPENGRADHLMLALLGLVIAGWAGMRWSGLHLEWHAVYEFARASTVEQNVAWFVPWIALKGLLPWVVILWVLRDRLGAAAPLPAHLLLVACSAKTMLLLMLTTGLGGRDTFNRSYLESACVVGVMVMLYLGVILLPRAWPAAPSSAGPRS